ncbi:hypothetical protein AX16_004909 [Volvariella volvacea WC 439]|nr:hypothetical protein AX16_004909 [Volvariella volvacea WC 439]
MSASFFGGARYMVVNGDITNYQGNHHQVGGNPEPSHDPLFNLLGASSLGAMHNAIPKQDMQLVDYGAPLAIVLEFEAWGSGVQRDKNVIWLTGPSDQISAASRSLIPFFYDGRHDEVHLAGTFFFDENDHGPSDPGSFVPTIAFQLAMWNKAVKAEIVEVLRSDPVILTSRVDWQWRKLVVDPIKAVGASRLPPGIVIIDSLCQCGDPSDQEQILDLISSCGPNFPIAFLITRSSELSRTSRAFKFSRICRKRVSAVDIQPYDEAALYNIHFGGKFRRGAFGRLSMALSNDAYGIYTITIIVSVASFD